MPSFRKSVPLLLSVAVIAVVSACSASSDKPKSHGNGSSNGSVIGVGVRERARAAGSRAARCDQRQRAGTSGAVGSGETCATADIQAARVHAGHGWSTAREQHAIESSSRWTSLREALMDPNGGVVYKLQAGVVFGLIIYSGGQDLNGGGGVFGGGLFGGGQADAGPMSSDAGASGCPELTIIDPALNNFTNMDGAYPQTQPGGTTPTQLALDQVSTRVVAGADRRRDRGRRTWCSRPTVSRTAAISTSPAVVAEPIPRPSRPSTIKSKIVGTSKLFAISLAGGDAALQAHLDQVATLGNTGKPPFSPMSKDDLVTTFEEIIGGAVGCEVKLNGKVTMGSE